MRMVKCIILGGISLVGTGLVFALTTMCTDKNMVMLVDNNDFDVRFTKTSLDNEDNTNMIISNDGKTINFETKELKELGDKSEINFDVTNYSNLYDIDINMECTKGDNGEYYYIETKIENEIDAKETKNGKLEVVKVKTPLETIQDELSCTLNVVAR